MVNAIKEFQKSRGGKQTGVLNPQERGILADTAKKQESVGWKIQTDPGTGVRLGIPTKLVPQQTSDANGTKWTSPTGTIQIQLARRKEAGPVAAKLAEREKKEPGRNIDYTVVKPDFFVLSGLQGLKKFYLRGTFKGDEVRILTILYDQATENTVEPVVIAMSSAFNAFPAPRKQPGLRRARPWNTAPASSSATTARSLPTARSPTLASRSRLRALAMPIASPRTRSTISRCCASMARAGSKRSISPTPPPRRRSTSPALPIRRTRAGAAAVTSVKASVAQFDGGNDVALSPAPALGFSGAAALDSDGKFAGIALLKPVQVAGLANGAPAAQSILVTADTVRGFLKANGVNIAGGSADAKASVVRVICVRK